MATMTSSTIFSHTFLGRKRGITSNSYNLSRYDYRRTFSNCLIDDFIFSPCLLFAPSINDYIHFDPSCPFTLEVLDGCQCWMDLSCGSEMFQHQGQQDVIYDGISVEDEVLSPLFSETKVLDWLRSDGLPLDEQQLPRIHKSDNTRSIPFTIIHRSKVSTATCMTRTSAT